MAQDIRELLKNTSSEDGPKLSNGHEGRFEARLKAAQETGQQKFPKNGKGNPSFFWLKIAAVVIACLAVGYMYFSNDDSTQQNVQLVEDTVLEETDATQITIGDLSPELKKAEEFYTASIQLQLASLAENPKHKDLIDGYKKRIAELDKEYQRLNLELNEVGPTEATINALIDNLKLRLELLFKLKNKLKELKNYDNEEFENSDVL